ncbi:hypothetical protein WICPIJ_007446 [Wickerhamomyces pijperi]|uniref:PEX18/PEX21 C-terminal domain-containing protein n=1 Tax=Wickerhamomyces pijperi TaxID=599730 RepID=A0A9P8PZQ9_WICPI|nr:hypothetical protein WICPIJ_007446 [Wickerhamomyces pijperi]
MADCGPINPLQQISKHSQQDRSLQQDRVGSSQHQQGQQTQIRSLQHSQQLDNEFTQRQQAHAQFQPGLMKQSFQQPPPRSLAFQQQNQGSWANDFAQLSLSGQPQHQHQQQGQAQWNQQFLHSQNLQQAHVNQTQHQSSNLHQFHNRQMPMMNTPQVLFNQTTTSLHSHRPTEHAEVYHNDKIHNHLEEEFQRIEASLANPVQTQPKEQEQPIVDINTPNLQFQQTAQDISKAMSSAKGPSTSAKFKNSQFLNLMMNIGSGDITLNQEETKLINTEGQDIHELKTAESLPDPLAGLSAEDITTPFATAQKVQQQQNSDSQRPYTWDEHYDDYRNDDREF